MDGTALTLYRTSCISGLAAKYLARPDSRVMVMVGAGALGPHLIKAHLAVRPSVKKVIIWNRTEERAKKLADEMRENAGLDGVCFESSANLDDAISVADIVSCATNSEVPLVKGNFNYIYSFDMWWEVIFCLVLASKYNTFIACITPSLHVDLNVIKFGMIINTASHEYEKHETKMILKSLSKHKLNLIDGVIFKRENKVYEFEFGPGLISSISALNREI